MKMWRGEHLNLMIDEKTDDRGKGLFMRRYTAYAAGAGAGGEAERNRNGPSF